MGFPLMSARIAHTEQSSVSDPSERKRLSC